MSITPKIGAWFNFVFIVLTGVAAGSVDFVGLSQEVAHMIRAWSTNFAFIISCANLVFHLYAAPTPGPLVKQ